MTRALRRPLGPARLANLAASSQLMLVVAHYGILNIAKAAGWLEIAKSVISLSLSLSITHGTMPDFAQTTRLTLLLRSAGLAIHWGRV